MSTAIADPVASPSATVEDAWNIAAQLSVHDRELLLLRIEHSLREECGEIGPSSEWEAEWAVEVHRRIVAADRGEEREIPAEEVYAEIDAMLGRR